jgi:hypothetical protein
VHVWQLYLHRQFTTHWRKYSQRHHEDSFLTSLTQLNGANFTGGGIGGNYSGDTPQPSETYIPFSGATPRFLPSGWWQSVLLCSIGIAFGAAEVFTRRA